LALQQSKLLHAKKATKRKSLRLEAILKVILEREREREREVFDQEMEIAE
jgi:hypothetical protein